MKIEKASVCNNRNLRDKVNTPLSSDSLDRRDFVKHSVLCIAGAAISVCCRRSESNLFLLPRQTTGSPLVFLGDSLTAGAGGTAYGKLIGKTLVDRVVFIKAIGGQNSAQIAARQGGLPIKVSLDGDAFRGKAPVTIKHISTEFLSTGASLEKYTSKGTLAGVKCTIVRTVIQNPEKVEFYSVFPESESFAPVPADSVFLPDDAVKFRSAVQILWLGRNNSAASFVEDTMTSIAQCVSYMAEPKRFIVLGILTGLDEVEGTAGYMRINRLNDELRTKYEKHYVEMTSPTAEEMKTINYTPSVKDQSEIDSGTFPEGMRHDRIHLSNEGYQIVANRVIAKLRELQY